MLRLGTIGWFYGIDSHQEVFGFGSVQIEITANYGLGMIQLWFRMIFMIIDLWFDKLGNIGNWLSADI